MTPLARAAGILLAAAAMATLAWASSAPIPAHPSPDAVLRLAWSARPERIERCRERSAEELARLPAHMRQPVACEGAAAEYRLIVRVDGAIVADRVVHGGGLRRDRRLYVFQELSIPPGEAEIDVRFDRVDVASGSAAGPEAGDRAIPESEPRRAQPIAQPHGEAIPAHVSLTRRVRLSSRRVLLVTYDADRRELTAVDGTDRAAR